LDEGAEGAVEDDDALVHGIEIRLGGHCDQATRLLLPIPAE
jgi:hypothetical protein